MGQIRITKEDYKIYEKYQQTKNKDLIVEFYNRFANDICNIIFYRINKSWYSLPIEKEDLYHLIWKTIDVCFNEAKAVGETQLISFILFKSYQYTLKEIKKFMSNGERIMNEVSSYEGNLEKNRNFEIKTDNIVYVKKDRDVLFEEISNHILDNLVKLDKDDVKKVIYLKSLGYTNVKIEKKLKFSRSYVRRILFTIKKIGEKF